MRQRLLYIDNLKGFLILLVVLGHCIQCTDADFDHNIVFRYIYSFHMPMFMAVSGFVSYKPQMKWKMVERRFVQLIVPFVAWAVLGAFITCNWTHLYDVLLCPDTGLWFLWTLFFITFTLKICDIISRKAKVKLEYVAVVVVIAMMGTMVALRIKVFGFQFLAWYFPFYCVGYFGRKYEDLLFAFGRHAGFPSLLLFLVMAWFWMRKEPPTFMSVDSYVVFNYTWKFLTAMVAIFAFYTLFKCHTNHKCLIISKIGGGNTRHLCYTSERYGNNIKADEPICFRRIGIFNSCNCVMVCRRSNQLCGLLPA